MDTDNIIVRSEWFSERVFGGEAFGIRGKSILERVDASVRSIHRCRGRISWDGTVENWSL